MNQIIEQDERDIIQVELNRLKLQVVRSGVPLTQAKSRQWT